MTNQPVTPQDVPAQAHQEASPVAQAAVLHEFLYFFIASAEVELLGGEYGKPQCHDELTKVQAEALEQAFKGALHTLRLFIAPAPSLWHLADQLTRTGTAFVTDASLDPSAGRALHRALTYAARKANDIASRGLREVTGSTSLPADVATNVRPLKALVAWSFSYLTAVTECLAELKSDDGSMDDRAVASVFACTDIGMGIVHALTKHVVHHSTSPYEFAIALRDQLRRQMLEEADRRTVWALNALADGLLESFA